MKELDRLTTQYGSNPIALWGAAIAWISAIGGLAFLWQLGSTGLIDDTEPRFAEAARQMVVTGDWLTPYFNGELRFDKPPLIYWLVAIADKILGTNEWAARLPSALSAIALMGLVFYTLFRYGAPQQAATRRWWLGAIGAAILALNPLALVWGRTGVSDMLLTGCIGLALLTFFCGYCAGDRPDAIGLPSAWYLSCYGFLALAILTKGPIGLVLPGATIALFLLYVGQFRQVWREMRPLWGLAIVLMLALPWFVAMTIGHGQTFTSSFFGFHNVTRFTSVVHRQGGPVYFYLVVLFLGFAPWSVYLPGAIARVQWRRSQCRKQSRSQQLGLFAVCWCLVVFSVFTIAVTKLPSYILPLIPALAILLALLAEQSDRPRIGAILNAGFFLAFAAILIALKDFIAQDKFLLLLEETNPLNLAERAQASGNIVAAAVTIALIAASAIGLLLIRQQTRWLWLVNLLACLAAVGFILLPVTNLVDTYRQQPVRQLASAIVRLRQPGEPVIMVSRDKSSLVFYTQQPVFFTGGDPKRAATQFQALTQRSTVRSVLLLSRPVSLAATGLQPQSQVLEQVNAYQILRVRRLAG